jgi:VCBS repeat-containing protein
VVKDTFILTAVTGTPDAAKRQVQARQLTYTTPVQSKTVPATGIKNTPAIQASGTLTFYNGNTYAYTVAAGTKFTDSHGVQVENTSSVTIPAGNPQTGYGHTSAPAIAVVGGTSGNIPANDFNETPCCGSSSVLVYNLAAFSGGQNSQHYTVVQQSDVNGAAGPLKTSQTQNAQKGLSAEIKSNEKLINTPQCSTSVNPNPAVGTKATSVTVSVTATCKGEVYDQQGAKSLAAELLKSEAQKSLGSNYALLNDNVVTQITSASIVDGNGTISLDVNAEGVWVYQFSDAQKQNLAKLIAGKSVSDARTILLQQMGVSDAQITISDGSNTLPTNPSDITIVINPVSGLPGGSPTATLPTPTGTAPVTPTPSLTITPEPGQGSTGGS